MILPEMFLSMAIRKNEPYTVVRMHFDMINFIGRMIVSQYFHEQVDQYLFWNLLGCAVCSPTI